MIEKQVILFVRGEQSFDGLEPDITELMTEGVMTIDSGGGISLSYQETELTGMEGTTTCFTIQDDRVVLSRTGGVSSQMVFQQGKLTAPCMRPPGGPWWWMCPPSSWPTGWTATGGFWRSSSTLPWTIRSQAGTSLKYVYERVRGRTT